MRIKNLLPALGALLFVAITQAPQAAAQEESAVVDARGNDIKIAVVNRNWLDVRVYAVSSTFTVRLGTVSGLTETTFTLPRALRSSASDLQIAIRPIGQRGVHYSQPILVSPGDIIEYRVENSLGLSNAVVY